MSSPPKATEESRRNAARFHSLPPRDPRTPLPVTIKYRGGPECWIEVSGRGIYRRYPGYTAIMDIVSDLNRTL